MYKMNWMAETSPVQIHDSTAIPTLREVEGDDFQIVRSHAVKAIENLLQ